MNENINSYGNVSFECKHGDALLRINALRGTLSIKIVEELRNHKRYSEIMYDTFDCDLRIWNDKNAYKTFASSKNVYITFSKRCVASILINLSQFKSFKEAIEEAKLVFGNAKSNIDNNLMLLVPTFDNIAQIHGIENIYIKGERCDKNKCLLLLSKNLVNLHFLKSISTSCPNSIGGVGNCLYYDLNTERSSVTVNRGLDKLLTPNAVRFMKLAHDGLEMKNKEMLKLTLTRLNER